MVNHAHMFCDHSVGICEENREYPDTEKTEKTNLVFCSDCKKNVSVYTDALTYRITGQTLYRCTECDGTELDFTNYEPKTND